MKIEIKIIEGGASYGTREEMYTDVEYIWVEISYLNGSGFFRKFYQSDLDEWDELDPLERDNLRCVDEHHDEENSYLLTPGLILLIIKKSLEEKK